MAVCGSEAGRIRRGAVGNAACARRLQGDAGEDGPERWLGWFRPVHCKSASAQETRAVLTARKLVQGKLYDIEMSLRGILRGFGLKVGRTTKAGFASRIVELTEHHPALEAIAKALSPCMRFCCGN